MTCPACGADNGATRASCWRCGGPVRPQPTPLSKSTVPPAQGVRLSIILPVCLVLAFFVGLGAWRKMAATKRDQALAAEQARAEADGQIRAQALEQVPLVNARANDYLRAGNFAAGLKIIDELLAVVDAPELRETKVNLLAKAGRNHEAYELLLGLIEKQPEAAHLHFLAGKLAETVKDASVAVAHFGQAFRLAPENKAYQVAWAKACLQAGMRDSAVATFEKLLADDPQCSSCWLDFASAYYFSGQQTQAINLLGQAVRRFPDNSNYHFALAAVLDRFGTETADQERLRTAASYYRKSLELRPRKNSMAAKRYYEITQTRVPPELEAIRADEIPLEPRGSSLLLTASINGVPGRFILDTGASVTCVFAPSLSRFKILPSSQTARIRTANGVVQTALAYADINLGQHTLRQALISVLPESIGADCDGLFGLDSLRRLGAQLDTTRGCLVIRDEQTESFMGN